MIVKPPFANTYCKQPPPISDHLSVIQNTKISPAKDL